MTWAQNLGAALKYSTQHYPAQAQCRQSSRRSVHNCPQIIRINKLHSESEMQ